MPNKTKAQKEEEAKIAAEEKEAKLAAKAKDETEGDGSTTVDPDSPQAKRQKEFTDLANEREDAVLDAVPHLSEKGEKRRAQIAEQDALHRNVFGAADRGRFGTNPNASRKSDVANQADPTGNRFGSTDPNRQFGSEQAPTNLPGYGADLDAPAGDPDVLDEPMTLRDQQALLQATATGGFEDVRKAVRTINKNQPAVAVEPETTTVPITKEVSVDANAHAEHGN